MNGVFLLKMKRRTFTESLYKLSLEMEIPDGGAPGFPYK